VNERNDDAGASVKRSCEDPENEKAEAHPKSDFLGHDPGKPRRDLLDQPEDAPADRPNRRHQHRTEGVKTNGKNVTVTAESQQQCNCERAEHVAE